MDLYTGNFSKFTSDILQKYPCGLIQRGRYKEIAWDRPVDVFYRFWVAGNGYLGFSICARTISEVERACISVANYLGWVLVELSIEKSILFTTELPQFCRINPNTFFLILFPDTDRTVKRSRNKQGISFLILLSPVQRRNQIGVSVQNRLQMEEISRFLV